MAVERRIIHLQTERVTAHVGGPVGNCQRIEQTCDKIFAACRPIQYEPGGGLINVAGYGDVNISDKLLILRLLKQRGDAGRHTWLMHFDPATLKLGEMELHAGDEQVQF